MVRLILYLARLDASRAILWCYLLWYLVILTTTFDPSPRLWLTSAGLAIIIGLALLLNAGWRRRDVATGSPKPPLDRWQTFRFFLMPFCVSSFSALVKGKGFVLVVSPVAGDVLAGLGVCGAFLLARHLARRAYPPQLP